jgi:hypothetical protein
MTNVAAITKVNRANFKEGLAAILEECRSQLLPLEKEPSNYRLFRDLSTAVRALELIDREIREGRQRAREQRSSLFTRYVIDEGETMVMDAHLRELIIQLEATYARFGGL